VAQTGGLIELVVIDNCSQDGTAEMVKQCFPHATLIRTHRNLGFFPALNLAIANSRSPLVMTVDDDAYFLTGDALARMRGELEADPALGAVTCNVEGPHEPPLAAEDQFVHNFKTGFTMVRREAFTEWVGYYPDLFFRSAGESYLASALWDLGRSVKKLAGVRMYHEMAMDGRSKWDWGYYGLRSQILLIFMRSPWWLVAPALLANFARGLVHFARLGRLREWAAAWSCVWFAVPEALRLRRPISWKTQQKLWRLRKSTSHLQA
jgi:GT2 family glycosyltransferase